MAIVSPTGSSALGIWAFRFPLLYTNEILFHRFSCMRLILIRGFQLRGKRRGPISFRVLSDNCPEFSLGVYSRSISPIFYIQHTICKIVKVKRCSAIKLFLPCFSRLKTCRRSSIITAISRSRRWFVQGINSRKVIHLMKHRLFFASPPGQSKHASPHQIFNMIGNCPVQSFSGYPPEDSLNFLSKAGHYPYPR